MHHSSWLYFRNARKFQVIDAYGRGHDCYREPMRSRLKIISTLCLALSLAIFGVPAQAQISELPTKKYASFLYEFRGACDDLVFTEEEYQAGQSCYVFIRTYPAKPKRTMKLQWWNEQTLGWSLESKKKTNKKGMVELKVDPLCGGAFCNGTWEFQIYSPKSGKWGAMWSDDTTTIDFYPAGTYTY